MEGYTELLMWFLIVWGPRLRVGRERERRDIPVLSEPFEM
jgi:hypothetical protein